jgi:MFS family permease
MKPLRVQQYLAWLVPTFAAGFVVPGILVGQGQPQPDSPISMSLTLLVVALIGFAATVPIASYQRKLARFHAGELKQRPGRPNPIYATRALLLAQAVALAGAGFTGWHLGYLIWLLSDAILQGGLEAWLGLAASVIALVLGWLGERNCRAPHDDTEKSEGAAA